MERAGQVRRPNNRFVEGRQTRAFDPKDAPWVIGTCETNHGKSTVLVLREFADTGVMDLQSRHLVVGQVVTFTEWKDRNSISIELWPLRSH